ncbi:hypothetical protein NLJ89_g3243 [Agrocybe chaxingu]|uniref:UAA transporter n=1 Tax=Agrocybe chaxingu TaxID=84603 RepID=A0A9W8KBB6_9AGAR|nr:hypothetical protein NLJ89_g3243 [Agrocybe chaxingu]
MLSLISSWFTTLSLLFGGCCSNAITLEQLTLEYPKAGSVLTFFQFLIISLHGLPKFLIWTRFGPRFRPRKIPITIYLVQVTLFYLVSLLNNAAFAYRIPMAVHIIFRSAGLVITMLLGWLISNKRYNFTQIFSVLLVTVGVIITTLSAQSSAVKSTSPTDPYVYAQGIGILTLALIFAGLLGLTQDRAYAKHGRPKLTAQASDGPPAWQESMFYLHFLALPMFYPLLGDLATQMHDMNTSGPRAEFSVPVPIPVSTNFSTPFPMGVPPPYSLPRLPIHIFKHTENVSLISVSQQTFEDTSFGHPLVFSFSIPHIYLPLILNTITQLLCAAGVHRLTTSVSALTVTLVLVVRKAVSLIISVIGVPQVAAALRDGLHRAWTATGLGTNNLFDLSVYGVDVDSILDSLGSAFVGVGSTKRPQEVDKRMMWTGAALVMLGTVGYTIGSSMGDAKYKVTKKGKQD